MRSLAKAAMFVDAENHADLHVSALLQRLSQFDIVERHAYADWRNRCLDRLAEQLEHTGFAMHHTWSGHSCGAQKNKADGQMERDIVQVVSRCPEIETVVIVSGDAFFIRVAYQLRQQGRRVIVAADPLRASKALRSAADEYLPVGELERWIQGLVRLEQASRYLTFRFVVQQLEAEPSGLARLIRKGLVVQEKVWRPQRGTRPEIRLNRQAPVVQAVLNTII
ncbi:MAG: NYN domain-containing protein [Chloroflexota bacterium]|nr:NYN domain-containing protein [Chloroflexota bacterium]